MPRRRYGRLGARPDRDDDAATRARPVRAPSSRARPRPRPGRRRQATRRRPGRAVAGARQSLRRFRVGSMLAVAMTGLLLTLFGLEETAAQEPDAPATEAPAEPETEPEAEAAEPEPPAPRDAGEVGRASASELQRTVRTLREGFLSLLPKAIVALGALLLAWLVLKLLRPVLRRTLGRWEKAHAVTAMTSIAVWLLAFGIALSVLAGDVRALVGSIGLVGLALSWALQTPIESFTGWLLNSFQGYYRVGDRIAVGDVFGDVYAIDFLTTTVWEIGGPGRQGFVNAEQPTGRLITFPNSEILTGTVTNLTRDFPFVWDELVYPVANESELRYARDVVEQVARQTLGEDMAGPAAEYERLLQVSGLEMRIPHAPVVFLSLDDAWTNLTVRYLVPARGRRLAKSALSLALAEATARPEHDGRIIPVIPRQQIQLVGPDGRPREVGAAKASA